jgi:thioredoxin 1
MENKMMDMAPTNNTKKLIAIIISIAVLGGGIIAYSTSQKAAAQKSKDEESAMMKKKSEDSAMKKKDEESAMMKKKDEEAAMKKEKEGSNTEPAQGATPTITNTSAPITQSAPTPPSSPTTTTATPVIVTKTAGKYIQYSADSAKLAAAEGSSVIFFHAPWCPTCKAAESDINSNISKLESGLTILKTDYDTSTELKKQYGVTSQSTFVKIDKDGKLIKKGNGFTTVDAINNFAKN